MLLALSVIAILFFALSLFFGHELLKKFAFLKSFLQSSNQVLNWKYSGDRKPGMYTIVLRGKAPFTALIGFHFSLLGRSGFDHYGFAKSDSQNIAVFSTYLGKRPCEFKFLLNTSLESNPISISSSEEDQQLQAHSVSKPHWFQRFGFFA